MSKKVAIVCYSFPPFPGVGGRRWAKFAHYLSLKGYDIYVICAKNPFKEISLWNKDIEHENIRVHSLQLYYPKVLLKRPETLGHKIIYHFWKILLSLYSKGTIFERSIFWKTPLLKAMKKLILANGINNFIISIPPFRLAYYASSIKKKFPHINLMVDYRDPWTDNQTFHGFKNISNSRFRYEKCMEEFVLNNADHVFTVSEKITKNLKKTSKYPWKINTLSNGFDPRDINIHKQNEHSPKESQKIKLIYAGTLYNNLEYIFEPLLNYFIELKEINVPLYKSLSFEFYGTHNLELQERINHCNSPVISIHNPVSLDQIQQIISDSTFGVLMSAPDHSFAFNTKFYEYLANNKPILLFSYPGETSDFIISNKLGYHINPNSLGKDMDYFLANMNHILEQFNHCFDINQYSIPNLTKELEKYLI